MVFGQAYTVRAPFSAHGVPSAERMGNIRLVFFSRTGGVKKGDSNSTFWLPSPWKYVLFCDFVQLVMDCSPLTGFLRSGKFSPPRLCCHYGYNRQAILATTNPPPSCMNRRSCPISPCRTSNVPSDLSLFLMTVGSRCSSESTTGLTARIVPVAAASSQMQETRPNC